jgi:hypothetical protein
MMEKERRSKIIRHGEKWRLIAFLNSANFPSPQNSSMSAKFRTRMSIHVGVYKSGDLEFYDQKGLHGPVSLLKSSNGTV